MTYILRHYSVEVRRLGGDSVWGVGLRGKQQVGCLQIRGVKENQKRMIWREEREGGSGN